MLLKIVLVLRKYAIKIMVVDQNIWDDEPLPCFREKPEKPLLLN